jgi:hypothetical protein
MATTRNQRLARILHAQLEDYYVHPNLYPHRKQEDREFEQRAQKVVKSPKTKSNLEKWFSRRGIPIRIVYAHPEHLSSIGAPGSITFHYDPALTPDQDPPTAWMILHNLAHAIYDKHSGNIRYPGRQKDRPNTNAPGAPSTPALRSWGAQTPDKMGLLDTFHPTTRSYETGNLEDPHEALYELFAQWVVKGRITPNPATPENARWAQELEATFQRDIQQLARAGAVVRNL